MTPKLRRIEESLYQNYLTSLLAGRRKECREIIEGLMETDMMIIEFYEGLFRRSMYRVGELWENNIITVANEHLATSITDSLLNLVYPSVFEEEPKGRKAVISCSANEYHQIGGKMVADILQLNGWDSMFLGANTPSNDLLKFIQENKPDLVGLSLSILSNIDHLKGMIEMIRTDFPNLDIMIGGQAFTRGGLESIKSYSSTLYIPTLDILEKTCKTS